MLATQPPTDHFNPAPHQQRVLPSADTRGAIETLVEADHAAPKLNEEDPFVQDLLRDGYAIARNVVPAQKAALYVDKAHEWLEGFDLGYKRDSPETWRKGNLPTCGKGGLYSLYSIAHAQFVWDAKTEPEYIDLFARIWGTEELLVSFDGAYLGIPLPKEEVEDQNTPWPHTDQSPKRPEVYCIQSLLNLLPNEEQDGGLWVMKGSSRLFPELIKAFNLEDQCAGRDHFKYTDEHVEWLKAHGGEIVHPNLNPGDVVFWDSRTCHWGAAPEQGRPRMAIYTCYKPAEGISPAQLELKREAFIKGYVTSHDPITGVWKDNSDKPENKTFPYGKPVLSERGLQVAGMRAYQKA